ncbi:MAG TPA: alpha/beta hydrolase [Patescibacteria group bacterium]|nr:alpha/beta hydrolase [Patescibacteria group bacterium]
MKKAYIIHGWDGSPNEPMHKWLKVKLEKQGFQVFAPNMPSPARPEINPWIRHIQDIASPDQDSIFIGHSIGCQAVLRYLETLKQEVAVAGVLLIAPWMELDKNTLEEEGEESKEIARPWMETPIDFKKVKQRAKSFTAIFSDDDPFVPLTQKDLFTKELGASVVTEHNKGHFTDSDGVKELPAALAAVTDMMR